MFCSAPDKVLVVRLAASIAGGLSCTISLDAELQRGVEIDGNAILLTGKAPQHYTARNHPGGEHPLTFSDDPGEGMYFVAAVKVLTDGGLVKTKGQAIQVSGANSVTLILAAATGFRGFQELPDTPTAELCLIARKTIDAAARSAYEALLQRHIADHQRLYRRMSLSLGTSTAASLPTDQRLAAFVQKADPALIALYFHYGRYLLLSSSRPGSQPANLQGFGMQTRFHRGGLTGPATSTYR